jgi:hypothetical protein
LRRDLRVEHTASGLNVRGCCRHTHPSKFLYPFWSMRYSPKSLRDVPEADIDHFRLREHHVELVRLLFQSLHEVTVPKSLSELSE